MFEPDDFEYSEWGAAYELEEFSDTGIVPGKYTYLAQVRFFDHSACWRLYCRYRFAHFIQDFLFPDSKINPKLRVLGTVLK